MDSGLRFQPVRNDARDLRQPHLPQPRMADDAVWTGHRLQHLKVIIAFGDEKLRRLSAGLECGEKVARLTLEFRRLASAMRKNERCVDAVDMTERA